MITQDTGENDTSYFGKSSVSNSKAANVTSDGITHVATMQAGYSGTFQWQIDTGTGFTDVVGATDTVFTPTPALADGTLVRVVIDNLVYTSTAYSVDTSSIPLPSVIIASVADNAVTSNGYSQLVDTVDPLNVIPLSTGRGLKFDGTQSFLTGVAIDLSVDDFTSLSIIDMSTYISGNIDIFGSWSSTARCYFGATSSSTMRVAIGTTTLTGPFTRPADNILEIAFCYRASDRVGKLSINGVEAINGVFDLSLTNTVTNILAVGGANVGAWVDNNSDFVYKDCYILPTFLSAQDISTHFANLEDTLYWENNVLKSSLLPQTVISDLQTGNGAWFPLTEIGNTGYVRNHAKPIPPNLIQNADFTLGNNGDWTDTNNIVSEFDATNKLLRVTGTESFASVSQSVTTIPSESYIAIFKRPENFSALQLRYQVMQSNNALVEFINSPLSNGNAIQQTGAFVFNATGSSVNIHNGIGFVDVINAIFYPAYLARLSDYGAVAITNWSNSAMRVESLGYGTQSALTDNDNFGLSTGLTDKYLNLENDTVDLTSFVDLPAGDWAVDLYTSYANRLNLSVYSADLSLVENIEFVSAFTFSSYIQTIERVGNNILEYTNGILESTTAIAATVQDGVSRLRVVGGGKLGSVTYRTERSSVERIAHIEALKLKHGVA